MTERHIERLNAALQGRYRIHRELGAGGISTVCLGILDHGAFVGSADEQRFVMMRNTSGDAPLVMISNWFEELRERLPS